ncbi:MAG: hypothetical protein AAGC64_14055, partial [Bacteroidota bacterium]
DQNEIDVELALTINENDRIKKGQIIGYTGSTGNSYQGKRRNHCTLVLAWIISHNCPIPF